MRIAHERCPSIIRPRSWYLESEPKAMFKRINVTIGDLKAATLREHFGESPDEDPLDVYVCLGCAPWKGGAFQWV